MQWGTRGHLLKYIKQNRLVSFLIYLSIVGCFEPPTPTKTPASTPATDSSTNAVTTEKTIPGGPRAAKIIFRAASNLFQNSHGSFDPPPASGTDASPNGGHKATRVFNADGSLLSANSNSPSWPRWLKGVEIGLSGTDNAAARNPACARFADFNESSAQCVFNSVAPENQRQRFNCGAPASFWRVSEYDCARNHDTADGNGGPNDGVYIRVYFDRYPSALSPSENILGILEYTAAALNPAPAQPLNCYQDGRFNPSNPGCSDLLWQLYLKHQSNEIVQPFLMLIPPIYSFVNAANFTTGSTISTKQFIIPLAGDQNLTQIQISRVSGLKENSNETRFKLTCNGESAQANSPLCTGVVFHSLTLFRM